MKRHDFNFMVGIGFAVACTFLVLAWAHQARCEVPPVIGPLAMPDAEVAPKVPGVTPVVSSPQETTPDLDFAADPPTLRERVEVETAMTDCERANYHLASPWAMLWLVRLAEHSGLPDEMRLWLPSVWCHEAAWQYGSVVGDSGHSKGPLQLQDVHVPFCGGADNRTDLRWAARCWVTRVLQVMKKVERRCPHADLYTAEAWVSGGGRYSHSCNLWSGHVTRLLRWNHAVQQRLAQLKMSLP